MAVIGGGNMAAAIIAGAERAGVLDPARSVVADPDPGRRASFVRAAETAAEAIETLTELEAEGPGGPGSGVVLLAVKPQVLDAVAGELGPALAGGPPRAVLSILAGVRTATLAEKLPGCRPVRVMPNTPAQVGRGMSAIAAGAGSTAADLAWARRLFGAVGAVIELDEPLIDAFTAVAGSGPAYAFYLAEGMARAGEALGLDRETALLCARQTLAGSGELLVGDERSPAELRAAVTSKGGMTAAALAVFDEAGLMETIARALAAARDRGVELAGG